MTCRRRARRWSGREEEALVWFNSFAGGSPYALAYLAPSHLRRAEIYERLGKRDWAVIRPRRNATVKVIAGYLTQPRGELSY